MRSVVSLSFKAFQSRRNFAVGRGFCFVLKFIYSEKTTKFCEISTVDLSYVVTVKSTMEISQNCVAFSEYMNFKNGVLRIHLLGIKMQQWN